MQIYFSNGEPRDSCIQISVEKLQIDSMVQFAVFFWSIQNLWQDRDYALVWFVHQTSSWNTREQVLS